MILEALSETQARRRLVHASHGIGAGAALHGAVDAFRTQLLGCSAVSKHYSRFKVEACRVPAYEL